MAVYRCTNCKLLGSGIPPKDRCPNCGVPLIIKVAADDKSDDLYAGQYKTVFEIKSLIDLLLEKEGYKYFLISFDMYDFIKIYYGEETAELFIIDKDLKDFDTRIINYDALSPEAKEKFEKKIRNRVLLKKKRAERIRKLEDRIIKKTYNYIYAMNKISELEKMSEKEEDLDLQERIKREIAGMKREYIDMDRNNGLERDLAQLRHLKEKIDKENKKSEEKKQKKSKKNTKNE